MHPGFWKGYSQAQVPLKLKMPKAENPRFNLKLGGDLLLMFFLFFFLILCSDPDESWASIFLSVEELFHF